MLRPVPWTNTSNCIEPCSADRSRRPISKASGRADLQIWKNIWRDALPPICWPGLPVLYSPQEHKIHGGQESPSSLSSTVWTLHSVWSLLYQGLLCQRTRRSEVLQTMFRLDCTGFALIIWATHNCGRSKSLVPCLQNDQLKV
jgi:hypothetical protein